jgi:hypothetical protein
MRILNRLAIAAILTLPAVAFAAPKKAVTTEHAAKSKPAHHRLTKAIKPTLSKDIVAAPAAPTTPATPMKPSPPTPSK